MPDPQLLRQADFVLSKCGRRVAPPGSAYVDLQKSYLYQTLTPANAEAQSEPRVIDGDTNFILRAISGFNSIVSPFSWPAYFYRIRFPDQTYFNGSWAQSIGDWAFARGSYRMVLDGEVVCPPGSEIYIDLDPRTSPTVAGNPQILFEGVERYIVSGAGGKISAPTSPDRYFRTPNQNIMAPEWMTGYCQQETPAGYKDKYFTYYASLNSTFMQPIVIPVAGGYATTQAAIEGKCNAGGDFVWREVRFLITFDEGVSGIPVCKITLPDGYAMTDRFVQLAEIAGPLPRDITIQQGRSILFDMTLFGGAGTGNCTVQPMLKGCTRRRAA